MSQTPTTERLSLQQAQAHAQAMQVLVGDGATTDWIVAGSVRRQQATVGDVEHVVIPAMGEVEKMSGEGLFAEPVKVGNVNLLWHRLDELLADGVIRKAVNAAGRTCWGDKQRAVDYNGVAHEFYTATEDNLGVMVAIRTGPFELSRHLVTVIKRHGYECSGGFHVYPIGGGQLISMPDEEGFFKLCQVRCVPAQDRDALWAAIDKTERRLREDRLR